MTEMVEQAAIAETHCAVVVFVGDRAYKLKKPVDRTGDPSDADPAIAASMAADFAAWPSATVIDTTGPADVSVTDALAAVTRDLRSRPDAVLT